MSAPAVQLVRLDVGGAARWAVRTEAGDAPLRVGLDDLLRLSLDEARAAVESAGKAADLSGTLLAPVDFFKATAQRVVGDGQPVGFRADSPWNAPEPELGPVLNESFTLRAGDVVTIDIPGVGTLTNPVVLVGRDLDQEQP